MFYQSVYAQVNKRKCLGFWFLWCYDKLFWNAINDLLQKLYLRVYSILFSDLISLQTKKKSKLEILNVNNLGNFQITMCSLYT